MLNGLDFYFLCRSSLYFSRSFYSENSYIWWIGASYFSNWLGIEFFRPTSSLLLFILEYCVLNIPLFNPIKIWTDLLASISLPSYFAFFKADRYYPHLLGLITIFSVWRYSLDYPRELQKLYDFNTSVISLGYYLAIYLLIFSVKLMRLRLITDYYVIILQFWDLVGSEKSEERYPFFAKRLSGDNVIYWLNFIELSYLILFWKV